MTAFVLPVPLPPAAADLLLLPGNTDLNHKRQTTGYELTLSDIQSANLKNTENSGQCMFLDAWYAVSVEQ
jgi:hypothetical protein